MTGPRLHLPSDGLVLLLVPKWILSKSITCTKPYKPELQADPDLRTKVVTQVASSRLERPDLMWCPCADLLKKSNFPIPSTLPIVVFLLNPCWIARESNQHTFPSVNKKLGSHPQRLPIHTMFHNHYHICLYPTQGKIFIFHCHTMPSH